MVRFKNKDNYLTNMNKNFRKMMVVFRNKEYYSRNVNEGPIHTDVGCLLKGKEVFNPYIDFIKTVVVFCKTNKTFKDLMAVVYRNTENYFMNKTRGFTNKDKEVRNTLIVFRNKNEDR